MVAECCNSLQLDPAWRETTLTHLLATVTRDMNVINVTVISAFDARNVTIPCEKKNKSTKLILLGVHRNSRAIHKAKDFAAAGLNALLRPFPIHGLWAFFHSTGIEPVEAMKPSGQRLCE